MGCCSPQYNGTGRFFSRMARRYRRRYLKKGLEPSQIHLVEGIQRAGLAGASLLEIGSGVGYLHQMLLKQGAARAIGVDMSDKMLDEALTLSREQGLEARVEYRLGDFIALASDISEADITLLDKVVCCYPDAPALVQRSLEKTRRVYALTYPRDRIITRLGVALAGWALWLVRSNFRSYVHDPNVIETQINAAGFRKQYENQTFIWLTQIYVRA